jgi:hypothetical protein
VRPERSLRRGRHCPLDSAPHPITIHRFTDDRTDGCASGADDVAGPPSLPSGILPLLVERFAKTKGCVSDRQLAKELQARNVVAERIAAVLVQRRKIGAQGRIHEWGYQRRDNQRAVVNYNMLDGEAMAHKRTAQQGHPSISGTTGSRYSRQ